MLLSGASYKKSYPQHIGMFDHRLLALHTKILTTTMVVNLKANKNKSFAEGVF